MTAKGVEMEEYTQITLGQWMSWKEDIRQKLAETAGNFVHIGYRLKQIRDSGMYDGAADIFEFAQKEYSLGKSTVSRFIAINEKYSDGGNSLELRAEFRGFSSSKLAEMLTLPDEEISLITEKTTIKEIRDLKNFEKQEIRDDVQETAGQEHQLTALQKCIIEYFRDKKELLNRVLDAVHADDIKMAAELVNPAGYGTFNKGIIYLFFYSYEQGVKYKQFGKDGITQMGWQEFLKAVYDIFQDIHGSGEENVHEAYYGRQIEDLVATSQQEEGENPKKTIAETMSEQEEEDEKSKEAAEEKDKGDPDADNEPADAVEPVDAADGAGTGAGEADTTDGECDEDGQAEPVRQEEALEGQMDITQFPEYMPAPTGQSTEGDNSDTSTGSSTGSDDAEEHDAGQGPLISQDEMQKHISNQSGIIKKELGIMSLKCDERAWDELIEKARGIIARAEGIKRILEVYEQ